jgi:hypothetical protein
MAPDAEIQSDFRVFWTFVQQNTPGLLAPDPVHRVRENWKTWWDCELDDTTRTRIAQSVLYLSPAAEEEFCLHVIRFFADSTTDDDTGSWVLCQLAQCAPFEKAHRLHAYHPSHVEGPHAVFLASRSKDDLHALRVYLIARPPGDWAQFVFLNLRIHDQGALKRLLDGVTQFLGPLARIAFCVRAALADTPAVRGWKHLLMAAAAFFVVLSVPLYFVDPYGNEGIFEALLQSWFTSWPAMVVMLGLAICRVGISSSSPRPALFATKQVCVIAGSIASHDVLELEGPSFGLPLAMALLAAIFRRYTCLMARVVQSASFAQGVYTGQVDEHGRVLPVAMLPQKLSVWQASRPAIPLFLAPKGQPIEISEIQPVSSAPLTAMAAGSPRVAVCRDLSDAVLTSAGMHSRLTLPVVLALSVLLAAGVFWLSSAWLLHASRVEAMVTQVYVTSTNDPVHGSELMLHLCITESIPPPADLYRWINADSLAIRLNSEIFRNVYARVADFRVGRSCELYVPLRALSPSGRAPSAITDLDIRVVQARPFWFSIPERVLVHTRLPRAIQTGGDRL